MFGSESFIQSPAPCAPHRASLQHAWVEASLSPSSARMLSYRHTIQKNEYNMYVLKNTQIYLNVCIMIFSTTFWLSRTIELIYSSEDYVSFDLMTASISSLWVFICTKSTHSVSCHNPHEHVRRMHHSLPTL